VREQRSTPASDYADRRLHHKPASGARTEHRPAHPSLCLCQLECRNAGAGAMILGPPKTIEQLSQAPFAFVSGVVRGVGTQRPP